MKIINALLALAGAGIAGALVLPSTSEAYVLFFGELNLGKRDFRVFNNFSDPTANDSTAYHANFPGYTGAPLAIWKAYLEWGSFPHGDGNGDPLQPGDLGSGGANFDPAWQGLAPDVGGVDDRVVSEISGSSGSVLAFVEFPAFDGWRIRFYADAATWDDAPAAGAGLMDIQGIATHEFGHAIGLDHTTVPGSTMIASTSAANSSSFRSIEADDIAGIQAKYGVISPMKPIITGVSISGGNVTITGTHFDTNGLYVWFSQAGTASLGVQVQTTGPCTDTSCTVAIPPGAGPGDILVRKGGDASNHYRLSNAWPFPPCEVPANVCQTSPNSVDPIGAIMAYGGSPSVAANDLVLIASSCPPNAAGLFFYGPIQTLAPFGNGYRCVSGGVFRLPLIQANFLGDGVFNLNLNALPPGGQMAQGDTRYFQFWYRNPAGGGAGFNLSDALRVTFCY